VRDQAQVEFIASSRAFERPRRIALTMPSREESPIGRSERRPLPLPTKHRQLVPQDSGV